MQSYHFGPFWSLGTVPLIDNFIKSVSWKGGGEGLPVWLIQV
jgi:hypothetical protein